MIQTVHRYIEGNIMKDISLNSIANHVGMKLNSNEILPPVEAGREYR